MGQGRNRVDRARRRGGSVGWREKSARHCNLATNEVGAREEASISARVDSR